MTLGHRGLRACRRGRQLSMRFRSAAAAACRWLRPLPGRKSVSQHDLPGHLLLAKNVNRAFTALAMVNLYLAARRVPAVVRP